MIRAALVLLTLTHAAQAGVLEVGGTGADCRTDPACFNRVHPNVPMAAHAAPGEDVVFVTREAGDTDLSPGAPLDPRNADPLFGAVHPLTGPVHIDGARRGDVLAVTIVDIEPGPYGATFITSDGLVSDQIPGPLEVRWRLNRDFAATDAIPGVRIPNASFPGVVTVLPDAVEHARILERESALAGAGGAVYGPHPRYASPADLCGPKGTHRAECLRTIPAREHGGNLDIRHLGIGATVYLRCRIDGCGLAIGDVHFAQGDGEVAGTAIEMDARVTVTTEVIEDGSALERGVHYEGPATLLGIPSRRFYATTGLPVEGGVNRSKDLTSAARNALLAMIDHIETTYGLTREQAYIIASVAVDLRIGQVVDVPNVGVTAILPTDIFID